MKLIYLHIYKDTYLIFMQVYNSCHDLYHKSRNIQKTKNLHFHNLKEFLILKLEF